MGSVIGIVALCLFTFVVGFLLGHKEVEIIYKPSKSIRVPPPKWEKLPSGWSRSVGTLTIYAMTQGSAAYWWVSRNGKTIIEGPSDSLDVAKIEAEREARDLSP